MEILGCGVIEHQILKNSGCDNKFGWAFGIGLERLAMLMFEVPDIRMLWTEVPGYKKSIHNLISNMYDEMGGEPSPDRVVDLSMVRDLRMPATYATNPPVTQNISFFMKQKVEPNDVYDTVREVAGELIESVRIQDDFFHEKQKLQSNMYEMIFRCPAGTPLTNEKVQKIVDQIGDQLLAKYDIIPRWKQTAKSSQPTLTDEEKALKLEEKVRRRKEKDRTKFEAKQAAKQAKRAAKRAKEEV